MRFEDLKGTRWPAGDKSRSRPKRVEVKCGLRIQDDGVLRGTKHTDQTKAPKAARWSGFDKQSQRQKWLVRLEHETAGLWSKKRQV